MISWCESMVMPFIFLRMKRRISLLVLALAFCACRKDGPTVMERPPAEVSFVTVATEAVERRSEFPGRIAPTREAQVRARATGILQKRLFEEGSSVREGQILFEIDPAPLRASLEAARAATARAEAALQVSRANVDRYKELVPINAISKQVYDQAVALRGQNEAEFLAARAAAQTAELNLGYTQVTAPISGRIGKAMVTEGALVSATEATQLALIRQMDPVYFDFTQSSADLLRLRRAIETGTLQTADRSVASVSLILEDGTPYAHPGRLLFTDISVDPSTGMITLRSEFPNPENLLLPGMFLRARIVEGMNTNALTIPQRTVTRGAAGDASVLVVGGGNQLESRVIGIDRTVGTKIVVARGLKSGERVVVEGSQKAPPGSVVNPVPFVPTVPGTKAN
jgi:membrane fusion protein, multidrug efflux system